MGNVYTVNEILFGALSDRPDADRNIILYIDMATGKASLSNGTTWDDFGGASYPGVATNGLTPGGLSLEGNLQAAAIAANDVDQISTLEGGVNVTGQGITVVPSLGNIPLDIFYTDSGGISHRALNVNENGDVQIRTILKMLNIITGSAGTANGKYIEIYDANGALAGKLPLYS